MKKNNTVLTVIAGALLLAGAAGCSDQLEIQQNGAITQAEFYQTDEDAQSAVATVYSRWRANFADRLPLLSLLSDEISKGGTNKNWFSDWKNINSFDFASNNQLVSAYYQDAYILIYYCNLVIDNVPGTTEEQKRCIAEAKFFRAYAYFHLAALYGETVPVVDHLLSTDEYHLSRSAAGELWALVESDLKEAAGALPSKKNVNDSSQYRVTAEAAKVYLGKAYLWQGKKTEAAAAFEQVIGSGLYKLWDGEYDMLVHTVANNCWRPRSPMTRVITMPTTSTVPTSGSPTLVSIRRACAFPATGTASLPPVTVISRPVPNSMTPSSLKRVKTVTVSRLPYAASGSWPRTASS